MLETVKGILFYAGIKRSDYEHVVSQINMSNRIMVTVFSAFATILTAIVFVLSFFLESIQPNRAVYATGFILSALLMSTASHLAKKRERIVTGLVHISFAIFLIYGIMIGAVTDPDQKTVTFMVMLIFMPTLFIDKPIRMAANMCFYVILFIVLCLKYKSGSTLSVDIMDAVIFGALGIASGAVLSHIKIRGYVLGYKIKESGRRDGLTQLYNRGYYNLELNVIPTLCRKSLACIFIDANGLKEINDTKGHDAGDEMITCIADQIKACLEKRYAYRLGGDEFVIFKIDPEEDEVEKDISKFITAIADEKNYHAAVGVAEWKEKSEFDDITELVKSAETKMRTNKDAFYGNSAQERVEKRHSRPPI